MTVRMPEPQLAGRESALISALSAAVVEVYGEWAREHVVVHLDGVPEGRWGIGGRVADDAAPAVVFGIRETALARPDGEQIAARLVAGITDALAHIVGEQHRGGITVELAATPGRTAVAGLIAD
jgi:phenylpyruvate tautomerase PptA (4-oxalocrotonate tautomerase family)